MALTPSKSWDDSDPAKLHALWVILNTLSYFETKKELHLFL